ncbi:MAG: tRNA threonylcarbamoyladenosine dehydratase, partial [Deltaproteobacteria bacterium]|nr:tRNA threonylcarbamoyladenosine dehydratase [Deltaproteobacteria bacterium]
TCTVRRQTPGSVSFVPSVAGLIIAGEVVCDLTGIPRRRRGDQ